MIGKYIASRRAAARKPGLGFYFFISCLNLLVKPMKREKFPIDKFMKANKLPSGSFTDQLQNDCSIELLFVVAGKDLEMLTWSVPAAIASLGLRKNPVKVSVIVPRQDVLECKKILRGAENVILICEDSILPAQVFTRLKDKFGNRFGWALQQFLKLAFILNSSSDGVLVVDADTILLERRNWLSSNGEQILTPSDEYNKSYYEYLASINISGINPPLTFVSHHMLMQPSILCEALSHAKLSFPYGLLDSITSYKFLNQNSPFSVDYEMYAQYLLNKYPEKVLLLKWANKGIPRKSAKDIERSCQEFSGIYNSLSFHSYL